MQLSEHEAAVRQVVGHDLFERAAGYVPSVSGLRVADAGGVLSGQVQGTAERPYSARAYLTHGSRGQLIDYLGVCTCPVGEDCKHAVALMLAAAPHDPWALEPAPPVPQWHDVLEDLIRGDARDGPAAVALQFDTAGAGRDLVVTLRPVLAGANGTWVRTGISWTNLDRLRREAPAQRRLLSELAALYGAHGSHEYYYRRPADLSLTGFDSPRFWDVLAEVQASGVPFVRAKARDVPVRLHAEPASVALDVQAADTGLVLAPQLRCADGAVPMSSAVVAGTPAHGVAWTDRSALHLAPLDPTAGDARRVLELDELLVPPGDVPGFLDTWAVHLQNVITLESSDASVELPQVAPSELVLALAYTPGRLELEWSWRCPSDRGEIVARLDAPRTGRLRDAAREARLAQAAADACTELPQLVDGGRLTPFVVLTGTALITFAERVRAGVERIDGVRVEVVGAQPALQPASSAPVIDFVPTSDEPEGRDWLDLDVVVRVDGQQVPFVDLFRAIAAGDEVMVLPSGTWFRLDRAEFRELGDLIAESRVLYDAEPHTVRVSRYQPGVWDELNRLGVVDERVSAWQQALGAATRSDEGPVSVPAGLTATLRPYQHEGFEWLSRLYERGLGGVLADEMGLGKTVQCLALFCRARERDPGGAPFLVVAPTSVVSNWAAEAARFAPDLRVATVTESARKRRYAIAETVAVADVVITSYALFRIDHDEYSALPWSGLVLDEAQFVKNHRSQAFGCATKLATPFKLAITGTPMENNLSELWAMFAVTAPGLFPNPRSFEKYYRVPIERGRDRALLEQLRRRIRPFLLRRTKAEVVADLPAKQEQVLELDLDGRHRRAYETLLARERRKIMGLLTDFDKNQFEILRSLTLLRQASLDVSLVDPTQTAIPATKLDELLRMLAEIAATGHRVIVFSQFTRFLERVRRRLEGEGLAYCYLDGSTRDRAQVLADFKGGTAPVFLISLKAGGFGLNLTEADYCILLDPWWNGAAEAQAVDRVHRIGQTRPVTVYRLVARNTIEQKVMAIKDGKAQLFASVMDGGDWSGGRLSPDEIRELLS